MFGLLLLLWIVMFVLLVGDVVVVLKWAICVVLVLILLFWLITEVDMVLLLFGMSLVVVLRIG